MLFPRRDADDITQKRIGVAATLISRSAMGALQEAKANYPRDTTLADMIEDRQAVLPHTPANTTAFNQTGVDAVAAVIGAIAGASQVMSRAVQVSLAGPNAVESVVTVPAAADTLHFIPPGDPIPAYKGALTSVDLTGRKAACIIAVREEIAIGPNGGPMFTQLVKENAAASFDKTFFSAVETDGITPSGLRFGTNAETSAGATKMMDDIAKLLTLVSAKASSLDDLVLVASPDIAIKIGMALPQLKHPVIASRGVEAQTLLAIATNALAVGASPNIRIDVSTESVVHMEDTSPQPISTAGSPANLIAAPSLSLFQTHTRALKIVFEGIDWKWRVASGGIAWMTAIAW